MIHLRTKLPVESTNLNCRKGTVTVEFAFILPLLLFLGIFMFELGRWSHYKMELTHIADTAGLFSEYQPSEGVDESDWEAVIEQFVETELTNHPYLHGSQVETQVRRVEENDQTLVEIELLHQVSTILNWPGIPNQIQIQVKIRHPIIQ